MSWASLEGVVARRVLDDAQRAAATLAALGVPHALVGGLAVGLHGHPRATKDVDFIVGPEGFDSTTPLVVYRDELAAMARVGVIDLIAALPADPVLFGALGDGADGIPVVPIDVLVVMKLRAGRSQDVADVVALIGAGAPVAKVLDFLRAHAPEHVRTFARLAQ